MTITSASRSAAPRSASRHPPMSPRLLWVTTTALVDRTTIRCQRPIQIFGAVDDAFPGVAAGLPSAGAAERVAKRPIVEEPAQRVAQLGHVARIDEQTILAVVDDARLRTGASADDGGAGRPGFEVDETERLVAGGMSEDVAGVV